MTQQTLNHLDLEQFQIDSEYNYSEGITYFFVSYDNFPLGRYWRDPWGWGWYVEAYYGPIARAIEVAGDEEAIAIIQQAWESFLN